MQRSRIVITCVSAVLIASSAVGDTGGTLTDFSASPIWSFQYDDVLRSFSHCNCEVDASESLAYEFYLVAVIKNDDLFIVGIDTEEFEIQPGNWDVKTVIESQIASPPNISYALEAELWMRPDGSSQWESFLDSRSETTVTD